MRKLRYTDLGQIDYKQAWDLQKEVFDKVVKKDVPDTFFLLEHPHTYTLGKTADRNNLVYNDTMLTEKGIKVYDIDRGGDITYHGPGQIVGYPIIDLKEWHQDTHKYLRALEEVIIKTCAEYGIETTRNEGYTGVWIMEPNRERKICAIGIKVSRWATMHGFAFNVNTNLDLFNGIIPCGIRDKDVTSLKRELRGEVSIPEVKHVIVEKLREEFGYDEVMVEKQPQTVQ